MEISQCALLLIRRKDVLVFDVNVNYVQPHSRTSYANDVKFSNFVAGTTAILNIGTPHLRHHIAGVTLRREKPNINGVTVRRRAYVREFAYLANLHTRCGIRRKRHLAASVNMQLRYDGVTQLRQSDLREIYA